MSMGVNGGNFNPSGIDIVRQIYNSQASNVSLVQAGTTVFGSSSTVYTVPSSRRAYLTAAFFSVTNNGANGEGYTDIAGIRYEGYSPTAVNLASVIPIVMTAGQVADVTAAANTGASLFVMGLEEDA